MNYKHCCVIDAENHYKTFVLIEDGEVQHYTLLPGETLMDANPPKNRLHAGADGFISPVWDADMQAWIESAAAEEIAAWESENPAPKPALEPETLPTVWDELDAAYQEGVNAAYE